MHSEEREELGLRLKDSRIVSHLGEGRAFQARNRLSLATKASIWHA